MTRRLLGSNIEDGEEWEGTPNGEVERTEILSILVMFSDTMRRYLVINVREESANMACKGPDSKCFQLCGRVSSWPYSSATVV